MTIDEAITVIQEHRGGAIPAEALDMAIRALDSLKTVQDSSKTVQDCISRQAAIDMLTEMIGGCIPIPIDIDDVSWGLMVARDCCIKKLPSVQPEVLACGEGELIQPEPCEDAVSRYEAKKILYGFAGCIVDTPNGEYQKAYHAYMDKLNALPSVQPEPCEGATDINVGKMCEYYDLCRNGRDESKLKMELGISQSEPCEDAVSRADVIRLAKEGKLISNDNYYSVVGFINGLPSVQPEPKWVPCSERLPEEDTEVLVSVHFKGLKQTSPNGWNDHIKESYYVEIASHIGGEWSSTSDEYKIARNRHEVIAWRPLPEPYKGE